MDDKPWLKHYEAGLPHTLQPYPDITLLDVVHDTVRQRPEHRAMLFKGAHMTYAELERLSDACGAALVALGVRKGDRVALLMPNVPQMVVAQLGAWKAGAIVFPINPLYTETELEHALNEGGVETVVVLSSFYLKLKNVQPKTPVRRVIITNVKEYLPAHLRVLFTLLKERKEGHHVTPQPGDLWLGDLLAQYASAPRPDVKVAPADPALLLLTGGTTGTPKAALGTHHALVMAAMQLRAYAATVTGDWDSVAMLAVPMFHVYGNVCLLGTSLVGRYPMAVVVNPRDMDDVLATIRRTHPAMFHGVPTLFNALLAHPDVAAGKVDLSSIKVCYAAAAPLLAETKRRFEKLTGGWMLEGYALTESMMAAVVCPVHAPYKEGSTGIPLPDVEIRIVDVDDGETRMPPGQVGEVTMRAPQLMAGFWNRPAETAQMIRDGWLYTGDLGYMDEDGYLFIVDRKKDVIKPSGFQVWPREVEEVLAAHPAVAEVAVAGMPDEYQGELVTAWVVLRPGRQATVDELRAFCKEKLVGYKVPRRIEFRDSLPKTMVGKVLRRELVAEQRQ